MYEGLDSVDFGHIAAEEETENLQQYFVETEEYKKVLDDNHKILITGRKGSGKSAVYLSLRDHLPQKDDSIEVEALSLHDYPWEKHKEIKDVSLPPEYIYTNSWKYIFLVVISKLILNYEYPKKYELLDCLFWKKLFNANLRYLYRFLIDNYGNVAPTFTEILMNRARDIREIKVKNTQLSTASDKSAFKLSSSINIINKELIARIIPLLSSEKKYFLLFDQLDLGWNDQDETKQLLIGLILAARDMVRLAEKSKKKLHIVIFLRSDIYEKLKFEDKNKLSPDVLELIWNEERLKQLIEKRIAVTANAKWNDIFTEEAMRQQIPQFSYIIRRTMERPRDIIQFCNNAKAIAIENHKEKIDKECIYQAENPYSEYMRQEIQDESRALPININILFTILQKLHEDRIDKDKLIEECNNNKIDGNLAISILVDLGILGIYRAGGRIGGSTIIYKYQTKPWETFEASKKLIVHPSLKYALSLVEPRTSRK